MRTTVTFDHDTRAAIERLRRERALGLSDAVNELIRAGLGRKRDGRQFEQRTRPLGLRINVANIAEAIEELDGPASR